MAARLSHLAVIGCTWFLSAGCRTTDAPGGLDSSMQQAPGRATVKVVKVYSEITYHIEEDRWFGRRKKHEFSRISTGTAFLLDGALVTSRHVLAGLLPLKDLETVGPHRLGKGMRVRDVSVRVRVSDRSFQPIKLALHADADLATLVLDWHQMQQLDLRSLSASTPAVGDVVQVWGFPSTVAPQLLEASKQGGPLAVVAVHDTYFVLNSPLDPGYSGGPIIDKATGKCLGLVTRSEERQARALVLSLLDTGGAPMPYEDGMTVMSVEQEDGQGR
jgi:hypothetical protein